MLRERPIGRTRRALLHELAIALSCGMVDRAAHAMDVFSAMQISGSKRDKKVLRTAAKVRKDFKVLVGIDVLTAESFALLGGLRVGLITNETGRDSAGRRTLDLLRNAPGVRLTAIFSPEHGLNANREGNISSGRDVRTRLPVYSLYGDTRRPTAEMLYGLDALVIDLQDVGVRFYTYITTMAYAMEEVAPRGLQFFVLDRPNPISPAGVRGPVLDPALRSFTAYFAMPVQHGMTLGEVAQMFNGENRIGVKLTIVPMRGYLRDMWYDDTGLRWVNPSPNLRSVEQAILYPGVGLFEGTNVSVGRGTTTPFELVGAPWIDANALAGELKPRSIPGVRFEPAHFRPKEDRYAREACYGIRFVLEDRKTFDALRLGVEVVTALHRLYAGRFTLQGMLGNLGSKDSLAAIEVGVDSAKIMSGWQSGLRAFDSVRAKYLLY